MSNFTGFLYFVLNILYRIVAFSSIIVRKDKKNLEKSKIETNASLKNYCSEKGLGYIENNWIKEVHLGKKRLHLNKKVTVLWQKISYVTLREKNDLFFPWKWTLVMIACLLLLERQTQMFIVTWTIYRRKFSENYHCSSKHQLS